jgi:hypothetical protein
MGILDDLIAAYSHNPDIVKAVEKARAANPTPSTAANRSFRAQTPEGEAHLDTIFQNAQYADLPQDAYDQSYGDMLFHHVGKPDLESYDLGASRKANELAPVGLWSYPDKVESDTYLRNRLKDYPDVPAGQTSVVTSAKNAFVVGADKPTEGMRKSFIQALERKNGWKYDELPPSQKAYVDGKVELFTSTGAVPYGYVSGDEISKIYTDNGIDMLVNGREVVHLKPQQARKPDAMFDPMMKGENNLNAFTGGKPDVSGGLMSAISSGAGYMPSDDTDYGEDATSAYADIPEQIWNNMSMLDKAALVTSPIPVVGAGTGILADLANMYNNPEERTGLNAALLAANVIPGAKIADAAGGILGAVKDVAKNKPKIDWKGQSKKFTTDVFRNESVSMPKDINKFADKMTDAKAFDDAPTIEVNANDIIPTQKFISKSNMDKLPAPNADTGAELVKVGDKYYVVDGHHRIANNLFAGADSVKAKVIEFK